MNPTRLISRAVIRLSSLDGADDPRSFLQGLVTNDVQAALPCWTALLSPQGKVLFDFLIWQDGPDLLLDCEADQAGALIRRLSIYRLRRQIQIALDGALAVHWRPGDGPSPDPRLADLGQRWLGEAIGESADDQWLSHRLSHGVCEGTAELSELLWLECNAAELNGVSFTKGCYVGQENTARMNWRQKVNRRLVVVPLAQSDPQRQRAAYVELGVAVDHRRSEAILPAWTPGWLQRN